MSPVLGHSTRASGYYARVVKRQVDLVGAALLLVVLAPLLLAVAVAVALLLGRPVLYRQTRVGLHGRPFVLYKFRTMLPDRRLHDDPLADPDRRLDFEAAGDPRHTRLGRFLRIWSCDELPQLWNVLRGSMSLVGPRPEVPAVVAKYDAWQHERHLVRPGLTGLWQVTARHSKPMSAHVRMDVDYVQRLSVRLDAAILLRTVRVLLHGDRTGVPS